MYEQFGIIRKWIDYIGYDPSIEGSLKVYNIRVSGEYKFTKSDHCAGLLLSILSANRPWIGIQARLKELNEIFHGYDPDFLREADPAMLMSQVVSIGCGNRRIKKQMEEISYNISILDYYENKFGDVDAPMQMAMDNPLEVLWCFSNPKSMLKFKGVAIALAAQYMKNLGIDLVKPDIHLRRILQRFGWVIGYPDEMETIKICKQVADQYGVTQTEVGTVLWQFCAIGYLRVCGETPECSECPVLGNCYYADRYAK